MLAAAAGALGSINAFYGLALVLGLGLVALVAVKLDTLPLFLVFTMFVESLSFGGGVRIGRLAAVLALVIVLLHLLTLGARGLRVNTLMLSAFGYGALIIASLFWASSASYVYNTLGRYLLALAYMLAFALLVRTREQMWSILRALVILSIVFGVVSFATFASSASASAGLQGDHNFFAAYQIVALPAALVLSGVEVGFRRGLAFAAAGVIVISVVASLSRGGMIALAAVVFLSLLIPARYVFGRARDKGLYLVMIAIGAVGALAAGSAPAVSRIQTILNAGPTGDRGSGRLDLWAAAFHGFRDHPWLGLGAGNFQARSLDLLQTTPGVDTTRHYVAAGRFAHSIYVGTLAEFGVVGCVVLATLIGSAFWTYRRAFRRANRTGDVLTARLAMSLMLSLAGFLLAGVFLSSELSKPLWILIGLALALDVMTREAAAEPAMVAEPALRELPVRAEPAPAVAPSYDAGVDELRRREPRFPVEVAALEQERARLERQRRLLSVREEQLAGRVRTVTAREEELAERERQLDATRGALARGHELEQLLADREEELQRVRREAVEARSAVDERERRLQEAAAEHERQLADVRAERLAALSEVQVFAARIAELEHQLRAARSATAERDDELRQVRDAHAALRAEAERAAADARAAAEEHERRLDAAVAEHGRELEQVRSSFDTERRELTDRLAAAEAEQRRLIEELESRVRDAEEQARERAGGVREAREEAEAARAEAAELRTRLSALERLSSEAGNAIRAREQRIAELTAQLEAERRAATEREELLDRRAAAVAAREQELVRRAAELALREPAAPSEPIPMPMPEPARAAPPAPVPPPRPEPVPPPPLLVAQPPPAPRTVPAIAVPSGIARSNLERLEKLVAAHAAEHPDRVEEWDAYLFFLREHADVDGNLPSQFDELVQDVFGELL